MKTTIKKIKEVRAFTDLKQEDFAKEIGVSTSLLGKVESGSYHDESIVISKIIKRYGVDEGFFRGEKPLNIKTPLKSTTENDNADQWQKDAFVEIRSKNQILEKEIERVWKIVQMLNDQLSGNKGGNLNFLKSFGKEAVSKSRYQKTASYRN